MSHTVRDRTADIEDQQRMRAKTADGLRCSFRTYKSWLEFVCPHRRDILPKQLTERQQLKMLQDEQIPDDQIPANDTGGWFQNAENTLKGKRKSREVQNNQKPRSSIKQCVPDC